MSSAGVRVRARTFSNEIIATAQAIQTALSEADAIGSLPRGLFVLALQQVVDSFIACLLTELLNGYQRNNIALTTFYWKVSILVASTNDRGLPGTNTRARAEEFGSKPPTFPPSA